MGTSRTPVGLELDLHVAAALVVGLEVLALGEAERPADHSREGLDRSVVLQHLVVVVLTGVGDPSLGAGEFFLQLRKFWLALRSGWPR